MKDNNKPTDDESTNGNNQAIVSLNIPITTTKDKFQDVLNILDFDAPLPPLEQVDQINLQITIEREVENG